LSPILVPTPVKDVEEFEKPKKPIRRLISDLVLVLVVRRRRGVSFPQWEEKKGRKEVKKLLKTKNITISVPKTARNWTGCGRN